MRGASAGPRIGFAWASEPHFSRYERAVCPLRALDFRTRVSAPPRQPRTSAREKRPQELARVDWHHRAKWTSMVGGAAPGVGGGIVAIIGTTDRVRPPQSAVNVH